MKKILIIVLSVLFLLTFGGCSDNAPIEQEKAANIVQSSPADMLQKLEAGEIDAFIAWEPFNAEAVVKETGRYLVQSGDIWEKHPCCVLAVRDNFENKKVLEALVWAHLKATAFINEPGNQVKVVEYAMAFTGKEEAVVKKALENIEYVEFPERTGLEEYYSKLKENGLLVKTCEDLGFSDINAFFDNFLIKELYNEVKEKMADDPNWMPEALDSSLEINMGYLNRDLHQLAFYVAQQEKYYQKVNLVPNANMNVAEYSNGVAVMEAFRAKEIDVAYLGGAPATLKRINDDIPIQIIAGANNVGSAIVVRNNSDIEKVQDLRGKTIAIPGVGTVQHFVVDMALRKAGITPVLQ